MKKLFGAITLIAIIMLVLNFAACGDDDPQTATYAGVSNGVTYTLKITENTSRYLALPGDMYVLTWGDNVSSGTVQAFDGTEFTLAPSNATTVPFTITVAGTGLSTIAGTITTEDGGTSVVNITSFTPVTPPSGEPTNPFEDEYPNAASFPALTGAADFIGKWTSDAVSTYTYVITLSDNGAWSVAQAVMGYGGTTVSSGRFLVSGNTAYFYWLETSDGSYYYNGYAIKTANKLAMYGGLTYTGGAAWTKQ
jgi:hypothetical protein